MLKRLFFASIITLSSIPAAFAASPSYNVFLIPSKTLTVPLEKLSQDITQSKLMPLYQQGYLPHITLYLTQYPTDNLASLQQKVKTLANQWQPFPIELQALEQTKSNWLMLTIKDNRQLQRLADEVTMALSPLRDPNPSLPAWVNKYPDKLASFHRYGSPNTFAQFQPHITLLPSSNAHKLNLFMARYGQHFTPITLNTVGIGIAQDNNNGQAKHPIATYYFSR